MSLTPCLAAIAETGTLMLVSGADTPTTLNFLPDTHIVVLRAGQVVAGYEDGWDLVRARAGGDPASWPRTVNLITGPSRTGDIEQRIQLGAHGPRRLHVVLVESCGGAGGSMRLSSDDIGLWRRAMRDVIPLRGRAACPTGTMSGRLRTAGILPARRRTRARRPRSDRKRRPIAPRRRCRRSIIFPGISPGWTAPAPSG